MNRRAAGSRTSQAKPSRSASIRICGPCGPTNEQLVIEITPSRLARSPRPGPLFGVYWNMNQDLASASGWRRRPPAASPLVQYPLGTGGAGRISPLRMPRQQKTRSRVVRHSRFSARHEFNAGLINPRHFSPEQAVPSSASPPGSLGTLPRPARVAVAGRVAAANEPALMRSAGAGIVPRIRAPPRAGGRSDHTFGSSFVVNPSRTPISRPSARIARSPSRVNGRCC